MKFEIQHEPKGSRSRTYNREAWQLIMHYEFFDGSKTFNVLGWSHDKAKVEDLARRNGIKIE